MQSIQEENFSTARVHFYGELGRFSSKWIVSGLPVMQEHSGQAA